jgi:hypothetical protein
MKKILFLGFCVLSLNVAMVQAAFAATDIKLVSEKTIVSQNEEIQIDVKLCTTEKISTIQAVVDLSDSNFDPEPTVTGNATALQFVVEQSYENKTAKIVGGTPGGIIMANDGCATIGNMKATSATEGTIVAKVNYADSAALGSGTDYMSDKTKEASEENESLITISVTSLTTSLATPTNLEVEPMIGAAKLTWSASADAVSYEIYYMTKNQYDANNDALVNQNSENTTTATFTIGALDPETQYVAAVRAKDANDNLSTPSEPVTFTTLALRGSADVTPEPTPVVIPPVIQTTVPQPAPIVQAQQQGGFRNTETGPEMLLFAPAALTALAWRRLRKKTA